MLTSNGYVLDESSHRIGELARVPNALRHDREGLWARLRADGYLLLGAHLDPELVRNFREYYFAEMSATGLVDSAEPFESGIAGTSPLNRQLVRDALVNRIIPGRRYANLTAHPAIRGWFEWFLGEDVHLHKRKIIRHVKPGETGIGTATQAHYDLVYLREGSDRVLSMWIPLGDCPVEMGGLTYLEGSHHWVMARERAGELPHPAASITANLPSLADEHDARWLIADYRAGDVVIHSAHMVHAATDNVDARRRIRLSTDIRYQRSSEPIDWRWQEHWSEDDGL